MRKPVIHCTCYSASTQKSFVRAWRRPVWPIHYAINSSAEFRGYSRLFGCIMQPEAFPQVLRPIWTPSKVCVTQQMMLDAVKHAQRQFPTRLYYREEAAALINIGDKVIQGMGRSLAIANGSKIWVGDELKAYPFIEDNVAEKYFHSRHNGIGHVISYCSKMSTGIGCGGCGKHLYVDWGDQRCWCRMGYENLYELKLLRWTLFASEISPSFFVSVITTSQNKFQLKDSSSVCHSSSVNMRIYTTRCTLVRPVSSFANIELGWWIRKYAYFCTTFKNKPLAVESEMWKRAVSKIPKQYDHIIVGAGSAGCVLASRLGLDII